MRCSRCNGLLIPEYVLFDDGTSSTGLSCVNCGEKIDPQILKNRAGIREPEPPQNFTEFHYWPERTFTCSCGKTVTGHYSPNRECCDECRNAKILKSSRESKMRKRREEEARAV